MAVEHYCDSRSPLLRHFGIPHNGKTVTSHVLHEDGTRCFNPHYIRDTAGAFAIRPWGPPPRGI